MYTEGRVSSSVRDIYHGITVHSVHKILDIRLYILYTMYMIYNLPEFRSKTREAFEAASRNEEVVIERFGERFELVKKTAGIRLEPKELKDKLSLKYPGEVQPPVEKLAKLKELFEEAPVSPRKALPGYCPHGYNLKMMKCKFGCKKGA